MSKRRFLSLIMILGIGLSFLHSKSTEYAENELPGIGVTSNIYISEDF